MAVEALEGRALLSTWTVNSLGDTGDGSGPSGDLRYCITQADQTTGDNTVKFSVTGTITLFSALPDLSNTSGLMDIEGPGATNLTVVHGSSAPLIFSTFDVDSNVHAQVLGLGIIRGYGGGIYNAGTLTVSDCTIADSWATDGGGINNEGTLTIANSTIANNTSYAGSGGAIWNGDGAILKAVNSAIVDNSANGYGGGISNSSYGGTITLTNCTITRNSASSPGFGGGIENGATATLYNTIVALNTGGDIADDMSGSSVSSSSAYNLIGVGGSGGLVNGVSGNQVGVADPGLGPLADNGGSTQTIALLPSSPAIDKGSNVLALNPTSGLPLTTDQRGPGFARIVNGTVDIGDFEVQSANNLVVTAQPPAKVTAGADFGLTVAAEDSSGIPLISFNGTVTVALLNNPGGATLGGTLTVTAQNGVATFTGLTLDKPGAGYTLLASANGLIGEATDAFVVTTAVPSHFTVSSLTDAGDGTLRWAITQADQALGDSTIDFAVTGTITLNSALPELNNAFGLTDIEGPGVTSVTVTRSNAAGTPDFRIFAVDGGATVQLTGLMITGGNAELGGGILNEGVLAVSNSAVDNNSATYSTVFASGGGGIANFGTLTVMGCTIAHNIASGPVGIAGMGGGIDSEGTMVITDSTIDNNSANFAGGIGGGQSLTVSNCTIAYNSAAFGGGMYTGGTVRLTNSTIANNSATGWGGGIFDYSTLTLVNDTIAYNSASTGGYGGYGGGMYVGFPGNITTTLNNSIIALNTQGTGSGAPASDISDPEGYTGGEYNLIGTGGSGNLRDGQNGNQVGVANPGLGPLADNGGPTETIALLAGSPPIDKGSNALALDPITGLPLTTDQRGPGFARVVNGIVDIGALEVQATNHLAVTAQPPASVTAGSGFGFTVTAYDKSGSVISSFDGTVTVALANNPGGATLGGTLTATAQHGVATFSDLTLDKVGTGYTLLVTANGLASADTSPFNVMPAAATQLVVTTQPPVRVMAGTGFGLSLTAKDPYGNVDTSFGGSVSVALLNNPGGATLGGTLTVTAQNGVATFSGLTLDKAGTGYTVLVTATGLTSADTSPFNVVAATQLVVTTQPPSSVVAGSGFRLVVSAEDQLGDVFPTFTGSVSVALLNNPGGATLGGALTVTAQNGVATFSGLTLNKLGTGYTLQITTTGLTGATTSPFNVQTTVGSSVGINWGTSGSATLQTAGDGLRLLPAGRNTDLPWLGIQQIQISLAQTATLTAGDITVLGASGSYRFNVSGSGTSYMITLTQPIDTADRVTITIGNDLIASFTRRLDILPGDFNDDGAVNSQDMVGVRNEMLGLMGALPTLFGDINGDGKVDINDYTAVRQRIGNHL